MSGQSSIPSEATSAAHLSVDAVVGHSEAVDSREAIDAVIAMCDARLDGRVPRAALLFASVEYDHALLLGALTQRWPGLPLIGGSTDGEMSSELGFVHDSVLLTLLTGDFEARVGVGHALSADPAAAIDRAAAVLEGKTPAACFVICAPSADSTEVVRRLEAAIATPDCPIVGGLTADHREFSRTVEFCNDRVVSDSLSTLFLIGDIEVSFGIGSGWFPLGEPHEVTASEGHLVHAIDGKPALELYRSHWGEVPSDSLGEFPIAVFPDGADGPSYLRAPLASHATDGWIRFAGDVPQGAIIRVTEVLPEGILAGSTSSMQQAIERFRGKHASVALVFSCAARKWVLGTRAEEEIDLLRSASADSAASPPALAGFYCFGEIAPFGAGQRSRFHNETCVTVLLGS